VANAHLDSPEEAEIAARMLASTPEGTLDGIARRIKDEWGKGIDAQFAVGRLLMQAADQFPPAKRHMNTSDEKGGRASGGSPFGDWFRSQDFAFSQATAWRLRSAAEREPEVRAFITSQSKSNAGGADIGVATAIEYMNRKPKTPEQAIAAHDARVTPVFAAFEKAATTMAEGMAQLPTDELTATARLIQRLAAVYGEVRSAR
jgi:hypothetical protein